MHGTVFGMFMRQETAEAWARKMEKRKPDINFLAVPVTPRRELERMLEDKDG